ncbi:MAG: c-type cytochrome domain-containing protein [Roseimicrobium sp.]
MGSAIAATEAQADTKAAMRVLRDQCVSCHKPGKAKGGLLLTTHEKMMTGGDNGTPVIPGKGADSLLYQVVMKDGDPHMPPKKQLPAPDIAALKSWIDAGAVWDAAVFDEPPVAKPIKLSPPPASYQPVLAVSLSPDEKQLAFTHGSVVVLVDMTKPERPVLGRLEGGHTEPVQSLAWTPDGKLLITGGTQRIMVWDTITHQQVRSLDGPLLGSITALAVDKSGDVLFAADGEAGGAGFLRKYNLKDGTLAATWKAHEDTVYALRLSPSGDRLLSGSADKLARLWDPATLKLVATYEGHTNHVLSVAFNNDATQIATAGADREVKVWDVKSKEQDVTLGDKKTPFTALAWTPDGKALAVVNEKGSGSVYTELTKHTGTERSATGKERKLTPVNENLTSVAITGDAKTVFAGGFNGKVYVWDAATGQPKGEVEIK